MTGLKLSTEAVPTNVLRLLDGRPQATIRRRTGWLAQYLSDRMRGRVPWSADDLVRLCEVLDVDPSELLRDDDVEVAERVCPARGGGECEADGPRWDVVTYVGDGPDARVGLRHPSCFRHGVAEVEGYASIAGSARVELVEAQP